LLHELVKKGLNVERQVPIALHYDDLVVKETFRADLLVEEKMLIELNR